MSYFAALPFFLSRSRDVFGATQITSTTERIDGLLRLEGETLVVQWRVAREIDRMGEEIRTDHEYEAVREVRLPLHALASASVRWRGWRWLSTPELVLTASDLRAFEEITGATGLQLEHPATIELRIRKPDHLSAQEFAAELNLARAEYALQSSAPHEPLTRGRGSELPPPDPSTDSTRLG